MGSSQFCRDRDNRALCDLELLENWTPPRKAPSFLDQLSIVAALCSVSAVSMIANWYYVAILLRSKRSTSWPSGSCRRAHLASECTNSSRPMAASALLRARQLGPHARARRSAAQSLLPGGPHPGGSAAEELADQVCAPALKWQRFRRLCRCHR